MIKTLFAVVDKDAEFVRRRGKPLVFIKQPTAERHAVWEGDAVVALEFNTDHQPLFIRTKTLKPG